MAAEVKTRVRIPAIIHKGDVIEVKTMVGHPMESGQRRDAAGNPVPRRIIHSMNVAYGGREVFAGRFDSAIAANPYIAFFVRIDEAGTLDFIWKDDDGSTYKTSQAVVLA